MSTQLQSIDLSVANAAGEFLAGPENCAVVSVVSLMCSRSRETSDAAGTLTSSATPLSFYGPPLSGKTLLAHGIAARWQAAQAKVLVTTGADYAREFADACRTDTVDAFSRRVRRCELLVIDGLDEMGEKTAAQEHLCRTLDTLDQRGTLCIFTLRHVPGRLRGFSAGVMSRLAGGLSIPVALPAESTRVALARLFAQRRERAIDDASCQLLAEALPGGVFPLASAVSQLALRHESEIAVSDVKAWLAEQTRPTPVSLSSIALATAKQFTTTVGELKGPSRRTTNVRARGLAMLAARKLTDASLNAIGQHFGGRDHTTVMHACRKTESLVESDREIALLWSDLLASLGEHRGSIVPSEMADSHEENVLVDCASRS